jgi:hypothetical protein
LPSGTANCFGATNLIWPDLFVKIGSENALTVLAGASLTAVTTAPAARHNAPSLKAGHFGLPKGLYEKRAMGLHRQVNQADNGLTTKQWGKMQSISHDMRILAIYSVTISLVYLLLYIGICFIEGTIDF